MDNISFQFLILAFAFLIFLYRYMTRNYEFWIKRRVVGPKPLLLFGNLKEVHLSRKHVSDYYKEVLDFYPNEPAIGIFSGTKPQLLVKDPVMLKDILIKSFLTFNDRGIKIHEDIDPLLQNLVTLEPKRWKPLRKSLTPVFTSGKLKEMFYLINDCAEHFVTYLEKLVTKNVPIEVREVTAKFTTDVIGVCVFGLNTNAMTNEESEFRKIGRKFTCNNLFNKIRRGVRSLPHSLASLIPLARDDRMVNFFVNTIKDTMDYRKRNNFRRNDFVDLLMDIKDDAGKITDIEITDVLLTAQAFVFFVAGFETSSSTMSFALYELASNPNMQEKLREEVVDILKLNNGKLTYENVKQMKYMDKVFKETLRKYPAILQLVRISSKNHTFEDSQISIPTGTRIIIPIYAIHHDSNIYPEPEIFDPERFDEAIAVKRSPMHYLPFGDGPHNCIGERFAVNQTKVGLAYAIKNFKFEICEKTTKKYVKQLNTDILAPVGGLHLKISKID